MKSDDINMARTVIVTGASRGIGYQLVKIFAEKDHTTIFAVARNANDIIKISKNNHSQLIPINFDLLKLKNNPQSLANIIKQHTDHIDILVNNAGTLINKPFDKFDVLEINRMFDINYVAPALLIQSLLPMLQKSMGHVVNITSMGGFQGSAKFNGLTHYSASKGALATLTECLASEYSGSGVFFNALALGAVQTEMLEEAFPGYQAPLSAQQAAQWIADFAINGHHYFNGKILPVSLSTP